MKHVAWDYEHGYPPYYQLYAVSPAAEAAFDSVSVMELRAAEDPRLGAAVDDLAKKLDALFDLAEVLR